METQFEFQDLAITLLGVNFEGSLLSGEATLEGDDDGFSVTRIALDDGPILHKYNGGWSGTSFEDEFFKRIAAVIENEKTAIGRIAEATWNELREDGGSLGSDNYTTHNIAQLGLSSSVAVVR